MCTLEEMSQSTISQTKSLGSKTRRSIKPVDYAELDDEDESSSDGYTPVQYGGVGKQDESSSDSYNPSSDDEGTAHRGSASGSRATKHAKVAKDDAPKQGTGSSTKDNAKPEKATYTEGRKRAVRAACDNRSQTRRSLCCILKEAFLKVYGEQIEAHEDGPTCTVANDHPMKVIIEYCRIVHNETFEQSRVDMDITCARLIKTFVEKIGEQTDDDDMTEASKMLGGFKTKPEVEEALRDKKRTDNVYTAFNKNATRIGLRRITQYGKAGIFAQPTIMVDKTQLLDTHRRKAKKRDRAGKHVVPDPVQPQPPIPCLLDLNPLPLPMPDAVGVLGDNIFEDNYQMDDDADVNLLLALMGESAGTDL